MSVCRRPRRPSRKPRPQAMGNVRAIATDAAGAIVERLMGSQPDSKSVSDAVDQTLKR